MKWKRQAKEKKMNKIKIALAPYRFENNNITYNINQIEKAMKEASKNADVVCFGEAFLQGFDALSWNYDVDKNVAISKDSAIIKDLCKKTILYNVDLGIGYLELDNDSIYSSYMIISKGNIIHNYRRISIGWKEYTKCDYHYKEGRDVSEFIYKGKTLKIALCGDAWDEAIKFNTKGILLWPVYVNYNIKEWETERLEYLAQASKMSTSVLLVNSIDEALDGINAHGGAFFYKDNKIDTYIDFDKEELLIVKV